MGMILIIVAGFIVCTMAIFSAVKMAANRVTAPTESLKEEITILKNRIDELENEKKKNT